MPKMKTHRGAAKRLRRTGKGRFKRWKAYHSHILTKKDRKRKRRLRASDLVSQADERRVKRLLPYSG
jgi:large subunit ribosomal protein L35